TMMRRTRKLDVFQIKKNASKSPKQKTKVHSGHTQFMSFELVTLNVWGYINTKTYPTKRTTIKSIMGLTTDFLFLQETHLIPTQHSRPIHDFPNHHLFLSNSINAKFAGVLTAIPAVLQASWKSEAIIPGHILKASGPYNQIPELQLINVYLS